MTDAVWWFIFLGWEVSLRQIRPGIKSLALPLITIYVWRMAVASREVGYRLLHQERLAGQSCP